MVHRLLATFALVLLAACSSARKSSEPGLLDDVGEYHRPITTASARAQRLFDQGLLLCFGFDHEVARRFFERAVEADPDCAMAHFGIALASGHHINNPAMDEARAIAAYEAAEMALALSAPCRPVERALIAAQCERYASPPPEDRGPLDRAYADAMREVWKAHPDDADVGALFAEALMNLRPWDLWSPAGEPRPETGEVLETLEAVLALDPGHPGALHFTIHAWEASPTPERARAAADRLRDRVPGSSHLVHMPGHIDMRLGRYEDAIRANERAILADRNRVERVGPGGFYALYRAHNYHFLMWAAMFAGRSRLALRSAREAVEAIPAEAMAEFPEFLEGFLAAPYHVLVRFGRWEEILREPPPAEGLPGTKAFRHYARGLALGVQGRLEEADREVEAFENACAAVPESYTIGNNPTRAVLDVARSTLRGEIEYRRGNRDRAFELLRDAVAKDDALHYDEPWGWVQPARHALGALLLEQGRVAEAEAVYRRDLERHPENGWSLHGLEECLRRSGRGAEAEAVRARFREAWARADVTIEGSCFCRVGQPGARS